MTPTFDLRSRKWIPVVWDDPERKPDLLGLREVLLQAHRLREIRDPLPLSEFGLYRLLIALVLDIFRPEDTLDLGELLQAGSLDAAKVDAYFERWGDRFDLFHPGRPFLQTPDMAGEKPKPLAALLPSLPSGTNAFHFHRRRETEFGVDAAVAARLLTTLAPFMTAGGAGLSPSINGAPPWYVLVRGNTLLQTLLLNACVLPQPHVRALGVPAWRSDRDPGGERRESADLLEALTWRPRRVRLLPEGPGECALTGRPTEMRVSRMLFSAGDGAGFDWWDDPNVPYRITEKGPTPLRLREGRELWRDTGPLALVCQRQHHGSEHPVRFARPRVMDQFAGLAADRELGRQPELQLQAYGMRTDMKMKVFEWRAERLNLPTRLLWNTSFHTFADRALDQADAVAYALRSSIRQAYPRDGKGSRDPFGALAARAESGYWSALRPHYDRLLRELAALDPSAELGAATPLLERWREAVEAESQAAFEAAVGPLDTDGDALRRQVLARSHFRRRLYGVFHPQPANPSGKGKKASGRPVQQKGD